MSGMGPASCWVTHKRLESWARAAKERALGSTSPKRQENGSNSTSSNNSLEVFVYVVTRLRSGCMGCWRGMMDGRETHTLPVTSHAVWHCLP